MRKRSLLVYSSNILGPMHPLVTKIAVPLHPNEKEHNE